MIYNDFIELMPENISKILNKEYANLINAKTLSNKGDLPNRFESVLHKNFRIIKKIIRVKKFNRRKSDIFKKIFGDKNFLLNKCNQMNKKNFSGKGINISRKLSDNRLKLLFSLNQILQNLSYTIGRVGLRKFKSFNCKILNLIEITSSEIGKTNLNFEKQKRYKSIKEINCACIDIVFFLAELIKFNPDLHLHLLSFLVAWKNFSK